MKVRVSCLTLAVLTLVTASAAQNCSTTKSTLSNEQFIGSDCSMDTPLVAAAHSLSRTYDISCSGTANATTNASQQYFTKSSTATAHGQCMRYYPNFPDVSTTAVQMCRPSITMSITAATGPTDFNRFFNKARGAQVLLAGNSVSCSDTSEFMQDFNQCAGLACNSGGGGGDGSDLDPALACSGGTALLDGTGGNGCTSPIIIDVEGEGFHLTSATNGVSFDISGSGHPVQIAWTDPGYHNAFLALDRNGNGLIDNGKELFGNFSPQTQSAHPNGFLALAEFDRPENGGNGDGLIDQRDSVYQQLLLWIDENHDGISQPEELHKLSEFGIYSLNLGYFVSGRKDAFGNLFRYKGRVNPGEQRDRRDQTQSGDPGRWTYDIFLVTQ